MISDNEVALIIGMRGCGKSTLSHLLLNTFHRQIIFDRLRESQGEIITGEIQFKNWWKEHHDDESFRIVLQFTNAQHPELFQSEVNEILKVIYETGFRKTQKQLPHPTTALLFEELQFYCTPVSIIPYLKEIILTGRHARLTLLANTQRPANIHGDFKGNSHHVFAGQLIHRGDVNYLRESILGDAATGCFTLPKYSFLYQSHSHPLSKISL